MKMRNKAELIKILDEHECVFCWTAPANIDFLLHCIDDFKNNLLQIKAEKEKEAQDQKKPEEQEVKNVSQ